MPGVTGIFGLNGLSESASLLDRMVRPMLHEKSYSFGTYTNKRLGIACGFVTADLTNVPQLVWSEAGDVACFISGDAFISDLGRDNLHDQQLVVNTAQALATLYKELGVPALERLNGFFCGVLVDTRHHQVVLFNDRFGLNRVYIHEQAGRLFFSSDAKSLLAIVPALRKVDPRGLAEWISCGCVLENRTLFRGIYLLPPGSAWIFSADGSVKKKNHFSRSAWENSPALSSEDYCQQLTTVFPRVLKHYINGSRPIAMSLTGGLDSRMIMAWAQPNRCQLPCYTFNGSYRDCADVRIARKIAAVCGQRHQTISVGDNFLAQFPQLAEQTIRISDGAMDVSGAVELYVNRLARQIAPVRLTGNYGSEILRRHIAFKPRVLTSKLFSPDFIPHITTAGRTYSEQAHGNPLSFIAFKQLPWYHYARFAIEQSQVTVRSPFLDNELVALAFRAPAEAHKTLVVPLGISANANPALSRIPTDRGFSYSAHRLTNHVRHSIEEFLTKAEYAYDYGMPNWLARIDRALQPLRLERLFLGRQKFCHFRTWYKNELAAYIREVLLDARSRSRPYLNGTELESLVNAHVNGLRNYTVEIHKLLSLELLHRALLD